jgi:hypothetical protein
VKNYLLILSAAVLSPLVSLVSLVSTTLPAQASGENFANQDIELRIGNNTLSSPQTVNNTLTGPQTHGVAYTQEPFLHWQPELHKQFRTIPSGINNGLKLQNKKTGLCLTAYGAGKLGNGSKLVDRNCFDSYLAPFQSFEFRGVGNGYMLIMSNTNFAISFDWGRNVGDAVHIWEVQPTSKPDAANQIFQVLSARRFPTIYSGEIRDNNYAGRNWEISIDGFAPGAANGVYTQQNNNQAANRRQFTARQGNLGTMLQNVGTNKCLGFETSSNGSKAVEMNCNAADNRQIFNLVKTNHPTESNKVLIYLKNSNLLVSMDNGRGEGQAIHLWQEVWGGDRRNQLWSFDNARPEVITVAPPPVKPQVITIQAPKVTPKPVPKPANLTTAPNNSSQSTSVSRPTTSSNNSTPAKNSENTLLRTGAPMISATYPLVTKTIVESEWEVWIVARRWKYPIPSTVNIGHAFIGIVRKDTVITMQMKGMILTEVGRKVEPWVADTTFGMWPDGNLVRDQGEDKANLKTLVAGGSISDRGWAVRKSRISSNRANWIKSSAYREAGCTTYTGFTGVGTNCNCIDYAARLWHVLSGQRDDFRPRANSVWTPDEVTNLIEEKNKQTGSDFLDNGRLWQ